MKFRFGMLLIAAGAVTMAQAEPSADFPKTREEMRQRIQAMTPEQRAEFRKQMKAKIEAMPPEQRQAIREKFFPAAKPGMGNAGNLRNGAAPTSAPMMRKVPPMGTMPAMGDGTTGAPGAPGMPGAPGAPGAIDGKANAKLAAPIREVLGKMAPADAQKAIEYVRNQTPEVRRTLFQELSRMPVDQRPKQLKEYVDSGKPPRTATTIMKEIGLPVAGELPDLKVANSKPEQSRYSTAPVSHANEAAPNRLPAAGAPAPALSAVTPDNHPVSLDQFRGKPLVIVFGSLTSPHYRANIARVQDLKSRLGNKVQFLTVYTQEAHPKGTTSPYSNAEWVPLKNYTEETTYTQSKELGERIERSRLASTRWKDLSPMAVDTMDNATWAAYGGRQNSAVLIDGEGRVVLAQDVLDGTSLEAAINNVMKDGRTAAAGK